MCPDNDGLRWVVDTVACGQLWRGSFCLAGPGAGGVPCRGISHHPPKRCPVSETPGPMGHANTTCIITRAGSDCHATWLVFPTSDPCLLSERVPGERKLGMLHGEGGRMEEASHEQHPHGPSASLRCPWEPSCCRGSAALHGHSITAWMTPSSGTSSSRRGTPGAASPSPPQLREAFQASRWGREAAAARGRAEKAIFSRYIFYKLNILSISASPVKASRAQHRDLMLEPVSQQRPAAAWPASTGRGWEVGSSPCKRPGLGAFPNPLVLQELHDGQCPTPSLELEHSIRCKCCLQCRAPVPPSDLPHQQLPVLPAHPPCSPAASCSWILNILDKHHE